MKIGEIISSVQSLYNRGVKSDDSRLSSQLIYSKMLRVRSKLYFQKSNKKQKLSQWNYQTLPCVELVKAPIHECPCLPPIGCEILKTKHPLPNPILNMTSHLIQSVTSLDGSVLYSEIGWSEYKYKHASKYTSNKPDYFIKDGYLYITHKKGPKILTITGLFQDPMEVFDYPSFCEKDCVDCECVDIQDRDFPIDPDMDEALVEFTVQELVLLFSQEQEDRTNNSKDDVNPKGNE